MTFSLKKLAAGAVIATASMAASALTLNFDDLPVSPVGAPFIFGTDVPADYFGFNFSSTTGTPDTHWYVATQVLPDYPASSGTQNITPIVLPTPVSGPQIDGFVISNPNGFTLQSMFIAGYGDVFIELVAPDNSSVTLGGFDLNFVPSTATLSLGVGGGSQLFNLATFNGGIYSAYAGMLLKEIVIWTQSDSISIDDIVVTPIPEPSTYAMMALGLAGIGFVARRRRMGERV